MDTSFILKNNVYSVNYISKNTSPFVNHLTLHCHIILKKWGDGSHIKTLSSRAISTPYKIPSPSNPALYIVITIDPMLAYIDKRVNP